MTFAKDVPQVEILLATYNGERFLREQINSLLAQDYPNIRILARDDGSVDSTCSILREYAERLPSLFILLSTDIPTGHPKTNFLKLLQASAAGYVCLSDQDDVWLPAKVGLQKQAMSELEAKYGRDIPLLVFSDLRVVDEELGEISASFWRQNHIQPAAIHRTERLLGQSVLTGCTAMLNRKLVNLSLRIPQEAEMHDRWIALLASTMGKSSIVSRPTVLYRQHEQNLIGARATDDSILGVLDRARDSGSRLREWEVSQRQAAALLKVHDDELDLHQKTLLRAYRGCAVRGNGWLRILKFVRYGFFRNGILRTLLTLWDVWNLPSVNSPR